jgi:hypothetical protein
VSESEWECGARFWGLGGAHIRADTRKPASRCALEPIMITGMRCRLADPHEDLVPKDPEVDVLEEPHSVADTT